MASRRAVAVMRAQAVARLGQATATIQDALGVEPVDLEAGIRPGDPSDWQTVKRLDAMATLLERIAEKLVTPAVRIGTVDGLLADYAEGVSEPGPAEQLPASEGADELPPVTEPEPTTAAEDEEELPFSDPQPSKPARSKKK